MKRVTKYQCEICGALYDTSEGAERCESCGQPQILPIGTSVMTAIADKGDFQGKIKGWRIKAGAFHLIPKVHPVYYQISFDSSELIFYESQEFFDGYVRPLTEDELSKIPAS